MIHLVTKSFTSCLGHIAPCCTGGQFTPNDLTSYVEPPLVCARRWDTAGNKIDQVLPSSSFPCTAGTQPVNPGSDEVP